jgi:hypothetical protein
MTIVYHLRPNDRVLAARKTPYYQHQLTHARRYSLKTAAVGVGYKCLLAGVYDVKIIFLK